MVFTNQPERVSDSKDERVVECYSKRWIIEEYHKCYKTGCSIEKRQFDSRRALATLIAMLGLTAMVLLRSSYYAREQCNVPFETVVTDTREQKLAKVAASQYLKAADEKQSKPYSTLRWLLLLGRIGGHQGVRQKRLHG